MNRLDANFWEFGEGLAGELMPGTIGGELQEWEQTEEMA